MNGTALEEILEETGYETRSYSGRGMGGDTCLGVVIPKNSSVFEMMSDILRRLDHGGWSTEDAAKIADVMRYGKIDSLGTGQIAYFRDWAHSSETPSSVFEDDDEDGRFGVAVAE